MRLDAADNLDLIVGTWGLIPSWSKTPTLKCATQNCRSEEASTKPSFKDAWSQGQRCIIPALSFDEPCWETGKNVWWRFRRADGLPWGLAGLWNTWVDRTTSEVVETYTMQTVNADHHPIMARMHKPDPSMPADQQDKRSVVAIEQGNVERWLRGNAVETKALLAPPAIDLIDADQA